jgi:quinohemoprotein ethanol dehydrogenase
MEQVSSGLLLFSEHCGVCHGSGAGGVPDLDYMSAQTHREFAGIVLGGAREQQGMPNFREQLDAGGVQAIQDFLIWKANQRKQAMSAPPAQ